MHKTPTKNVIIAITAFVLLDLVLLIIEAIAHTNPFSLQQATLNMLAAFYCGHLYFIDFVTFGALNANWNNILGLSAWIMLLAVPLIILVLYIASGKRGYFYFATLVGFAVYVTPMILEIMHMIPWCGS